MNLQCQSCGMLLQKDSSNRGTEKDGTKSTLFCNLCYKDGQFVWKDATIKSMQEFMETKLTEQNINWFMKKIAILQIPHLERWWRQGLPKQAYSYLIIFNTLRNQFFIQTQVFKLLSKVSLSPLSIYSTDVKLLKALSRLVIFSSLQAISVLIMLLNMILSPLKE